MRKAVSYILYFIGFVCAFSFLFEVYVETDKGDTLYRSPEYAAVVIVISLLIYFAFRDAAVIVRGKKFTEE